MDQPFSNTPRGRVIVLALHTLRDVSETLQRGDSGGKFTPESRILQMPSAYHAGFYPELVESLLKLRRMGRQHYWHVTERHVFFERNTRTLVAVGSRFYEEEHDSFFVNGETHHRYRAADPVPSNCAVVRVVKMPKATVAKREGQAATLVRAIVERWDAGVRGSTVETGLAFVSAYLPRRLELPREVMAA